MMKREDVLSIVYDGIDVLNDENGTDVAKEESTVLFGINHALDSLDFVSLIVHIEDAVLKKHGVFISITAEKAMSQKNSPFRTIGTLTDYVLNLCHEDFNNRYEQGDRA